MYAPTYSLTRTTELQLVAARDSGDRNAIAQLAQFVEPIIKSEAIRYTRGFERVALEDLLQAGRVGALEAAKSFTGKRSDGNTSSAPGFPAYAAQIIRNEISSAVRESSAPVKIPEDVWKRKSRANPADIAAADSWNFTEELDAPTDEGYAMHETVAAPEGSNIDLTLDVQLAMLALNEQQRRVIRGVLDGEPMTDVAAALSLTASRVTQIKITAFAMLTAELESYRTA